jgi:hypothetical protein
MMAELRALDGDGETDNVKRLNAWLAAGTGRTHEVDDTGRHLLRELGILMGSSRDLGVAVDAATRLSAPHVAEPREGEPLYRRGVPIRRRPLAGDYPLTSLCTCGKTIDRASAEAKWAHREWA